MTQTNALTSRMFTPALGSKHFSDTRPILMASTVRKDPSLQIREAASLGDFSTSTYQKYMKSLRRRTPISAATVTHDNDSDCNICAIHQSPHEVGKVVSLMKSKKLKTAAICFFGSLIATKEKNSYMSIYTKYIYKIPHLAEQIKVVESHKYLGVVLDQKLHGKAHLVSKGKNL